MSRKAKIKGRTGEANGISTARKLASDKSSQGKLCLDQRIRKQGVGTLRSQQVAGKRLDGRGGDSDVAGAKLARAVAVQKGA